MATSLDFSFVGNDSEKFKYNFMVLMINYMIGLFIFYDEIKFFNFILK